MNSKSDVHHPCLEDAPEVLNRFEFRAVGRQDEGRRCGRVPRRTPSGYELSPVKWCMKTSELRSGGCPAECQDMSGCNGVVAALRCGQRGQAIEPRSGLIACTVVGKSRSELSKMAVGGLWAGTPEASAKRPVHMPSIDSVSRGAVHGGFGVATLLHRLPPTLELPGRGAPSSSR
jgi:hypothetical protein